MPAVDDAEALLRELLPPAGRTGLPRARIFKEAKASKIGRDSIYEAADRLGVVKERRTDFDAGEAYSWWRMPTAEELAAAEASDPARLSAEVAYLRCKIECWRRVDAQQMRALAAKADHIAASRRQLDGGQAPDTTMGSDAG